MRNIRKILFFTYMMTMLACGEDAVNEIIQEWELAPASNLNTSAGSAVVLDENDPDESIDFSWDDAVAELDFEVSHRVVIDSLGSTAFGTPILELSVGDDGQGTSASVSAKDLNEIMSKLGYPADAESDLTWAVIATSVEKESIATSDIKVKRFATEIIPETLYLSGAAAEDFGDISQAMEFKKLNAADWSASNKHEIYAQLNSTGTFKVYGGRELPAHNYGGSDGVLVKSGTALSVDEDGEYRITVDIDNGTYSIFKIDRWSVVGSPINGGWGGDEPLDYQGSGVWSKSLVLPGTGGFVFRANWDWGQLLKRVVGSENTLVLEGDAEGQGVSFEDVPFDQEPGRYVFTLDLSSQSRSYTIAIDDRSVDAPDALFLFVNGMSMGELSKDGAVFSSDQYFAIQAGDQVSFNSAADGSGTSYTMGANLGATDNPEGDKVEANEQLMEGSSAITADRDQAYRFTLDFLAGNVNWVYYNIKLFHWGDANGGWDGRDEFAMTYAHPLTFNITTDLIAGFDMKFISPWDHDFGTTDAASLTGSIVNKGGQNFKNISSGGTYQVTIVIDGNYQNGTYEFKQ